MISSKKLRQMFLDFMKSKGHAIIPSSSLVPKEDPTVLFMNSGMQPLVPYLMGIEKHPAGKSLANSQKCIRTGDIEEVGDNRHLTFFEMLGNWSLGDYFKTESIPWSFEFLTSKKWLGLDPKRLYVTVYQGNEEIPPDQVSTKTWAEEFAKVGITADIGDQYNFKNPKTNQPGTKYRYRITRMNAKENWWGLPYRGPCGSDTEIFYLLDSQPKDFEETILPNLSVEQVDDYIENNLVEIWNNVFMEYEGEWGSNGEPTKLKPLKQKNVDTGMGFERILTVLNGYSTVYETDLLKPLVDTIEKWQKKI